MTVIIIVVTAIFSTGTHRLKESLKRSPLDPLILTMTLLTYYSVAMV